jgi:glycosyltransferase involved in cell wall biosynthesis
MPIDAQGDSSKAMWMSPGASGMSALSDLAVHADEGLMRWGSAMSPVPTAGSILHLGTGWYPERKGGAESVYYNLHAQLLRQGFDVHGVVPGSPRAQQDTADRVRSFDPAGLSLLRRGQAIRSAAAPFLSEADVIASHFGLYALPLLDRIARCPFVMHFHGPWALESAAEGEGPIATGIKRIIERVVYRRADRVLVLSDAFGSILRERYGVPGDLIRKVPGGVDCDRFDIGPSRLDARRKLGWVRDRPILITIRRLVRRMGLSNLIEAMAGLPSGAGRDAVLYIVGTGPERAALETLAANLGLAERVRFTGLLPDSELPLAYRAADLAVVPSRDLEGFGLMAAEALAAGTPVLVTPVGGLPEVVSPLSKSLLLNGKDPPSIARGIGEALSDPTRLPDARACAAYARTHFDWSTIGDQVAAVYRELL